MQSTSCRFGVADIQADLQPSPDGQMPDRCRSDQLVRQGILICTDNDWSRICAAEEFESTIDLTSKVLRRFDYFAGSNSEHTRAIAGSFDAASIEVTMRKP